MVNLSAPYRAPRRIEQPATTDLTTAVDFERARSRSVVDMAMTISAAARLSGVSAHTLRYYERAGLLDAVGRDDSSGHRRTEAHREVVLAGLEEAQRTLQLVDFKINLYREKLA
jgi:hypothetical protein